MDWVGSTELTLPRGSIGLINPSFPKPAPVSYDPSSRFSSELGFLYTCQHNPMSKSALITGITGQDGSYLAELLLEKGYDVHGLVRRSSTFSTERIDHIYQDVHAESRLRLHYGDLTDGQALTNLVLEIQPDEIYNLGCSEPRPRLLRSTGLHAADRWRRRAERARSGKAAEQGKAGSRLSGQQQRNVRRRAGNAANGNDSIQSSVALCLCEGLRVPSNRQLSPRLRHVRQQRNSVQSRIGTSWRDLCDSQDHASSGRIKVGLQEKLYLGNLDAKRDWGYAKDYVEGMWRILQHDEPDDFVLATGRTESVRDFCKLVFEQLELNYEDYVEIDPRYFRPAEVDLLLGDPIQGER